MLKTWVSKHLNHSNILLYLLIFFLPIQTRYIFWQLELNGEIYALGNISIYIVDLIFLGILFSLIHFSFTKDTHQHIQTYKWLWVGIIALDVIVFLSMLLSIHIPLSVHGYTRFLQGIVIVFFMVITMYSERILYSVFVAQGIIQSILALLQFQTGSVFASKWLGMSSQFVQNVGASVIEVHGERFLRAYGTFPHPNMLGGFLCVTLLMCLHLLIHETKKKWMIIWSCAFLIIFTGLMYTFSRSAWIAFLLSFTVYVVYTMITYKQIRKKVMQITLSMGVFFVIFFFLHAPLFTTRFFSQERLEVQSVVSRMSQYSQAWEILSTYPFFGVGIHTYGFALYQLIDATKSVWEYEVIHNMYVLIASEIGIFGMMIFLSIVISFLFYVYKKKISFFSFILLLSLLIIGLFDHYLWTIPFGILFFWVIIGHGIKNKRIKN